MSIWGIKFLCNFHCCLCSVLYIVKLSKNSSSENLHLAILSTVVVVQWTLVSDSSWPHGLQHTRLLCLSPSLGGCSNSCALSQWCHPTILSSVIPFSSCLQSVSASGSFLMSQLFSSGGQSIRASASASVLSMKFRTGLISLQSKGLARVSSNTTAFQL